jgi:hypothetical protein
MCWASRLFSLSKSGVELAGISFSQDSFEMGWDGVIQTIAKEKFADFF